MQINWLVSIWWRTLVLNELARQQQLWKIYFTFYISHTTSGISKFLTHLVQYSISVPPETKGFMTLSRGIEMEHWVKMGWEKFFFRVLLGTSFRLLPVNTPRAFHVETTWKNRFNVEYMRCDFRTTIRRLKRKRAICSKSDLWTFDGFQTKP